MKKTDWRLIIGIVGWTLIVLIWIYIAIRYFRKGDTVGALLNLLVALTWGIFGYVSLKKYKRGK